VLSSGFPSAKLDHLAQTSSYATAPDQRFRLYLRSLVYLCQRAPMAKFICTPFSII